MKRHMKAMEWGMWKRKYRRPLELNLKDSPNNDRVGRHSMNTCWVPGTGPRALQTYIPLSALATILGGRM